MSIVQRDLYWRALKEWTEGELSDLLIKKKTLF
jgi:hypothetical protein